MNEFNPDWRASPGETLKQLMEVDHISIRNLSKITGLTSETICQIREAKIPVELGVAECLAAYHANAEYWLSLEKNYRKPTAEYVSRFHDVANTLKQILSGITHDECGYLMIIVPFDDLNNPDIMSTLSEEQMIEVLENSIDKVKQRS